MPTPTPSSPARRAAEFEARVARRQLTSRSWPQAAASCPPCAPRGRQASTTWSARAGRAWQRCWRTGPPRPRSRPATASTRAPSLTMLRAIDRLAGAQPVRLVPTFLGAHAVPAEYAARPDDYVSMLIGEMLPAVAAGQARRERARLLRCLLRGGRVHGSTSRARSWKPRRGWACGPRSTPMSSRPSEARHWPRNSAPCPPITWPAPVRPRSRGWPRPGWWRCCSPGRLWVSASATSQTAARWWMPGCPWRWGPTSTPAPAGASRCRWSPLWPAVTTGSRRRRPSLPRL